MICAGKGDLGEMICARSGKGFMLKGGGYVLAFLAEGSGQFRLKV